MTTKNIKAIIQITKKFGVRYALSRVKDYIKIKHIDRKTLRLYNKTKPQGTIIKTIIGSKMQLNMNDCGIHKDLFLSDIREPAATDYFMKIINKDDIILDIGANIGYYVLIGAKRAKKIYAVEPVPENFQNLNLNLKLNNYSNVETYQIALGDKIGEQEMYLSTKSNWHSFYKPANFIKTIKIKMDTVDNFLKDKITPTFVRMDVEGYETAIIKGMPETLKKIKKMFIEVHSEILSDQETRELLDTIQKAGFSPELIAKYDRPGLSRILSNNHIDKIYQGDEGNYEIFFVKK